MYILCAVTSVWQVHLVPLATLGSVVMTLRLTSPYEMQLLDRYSPNSNSVQEMQTVVLSQPTWSPSGCWHWGARCG